MPTSSEPLTPQIVVVTLTTANTEFSQVFPNKTKYFSMQARTAVDIRWAFETGRVATPTDPYATVKSGNWYNSPEKLSGNPTIYLASGTAATPVELIFWLATP